VSSDWEFEIWPDFHDGADCSLFTEGAEFLIDVRTNLNATYLWREWEYRKYLREHGVEISDEQSEDLERNPIAKLGVVHMVKRLGVNPFSDDSEFVHIGAGSLGWALLHRPTGHVFKLTVDIAEAISAHRIIKTYGDDQHPGLAKTFSVSRGFRIPGTRVGLWVIEKEYVPLGVHTIPHYDYLIQLLAQVRHKMTRHAQIVFGSYIGCIVEDRKAVLKVAERIVDEIYRSAEALRGALLEGTFKIVLKNAEFIAESVNALANAGVAFYDFLPGNIRARRLNSGTVPCLIDIGASINANSIVTKVALKGIRAEDSVSDKVEGIYKLAALIAKHLPTFVDNEEED